MLTRNDTDSNRPADEDGRAQAARTARLNRGLLVAVILLSVAMAGLIGWMFGRNQVPGMPNGAVPAPGHAAHHDCTLVLPERGVALVRGIRCGHATPLIDAHCDEGHAMKAFILEMFKQGLSDDEIKAALLRRYGEKELAGREW